MGKASKHPNNKTLKEALAELAPEPDTRTLDEKVQDLSNDLTLLEERLQAIEYYLNV